MKKFVFLSAVLLLFAITGKGQLPELPKNIQSPNAAGLGMYGDIPVSLFTGLPQIEIPLYEVNEGQIKVPIFLSYHASGFRPDQHPGWVGMGWTLNAGGCITRVVKDIPDESDNKGYYNGQESGYYFPQNQEVLNKTNWNTVENIEDIAKNTDKAQKDTEPDEFSFSFGGYSGKFFMNADGKWKVRSDSPIKVICEAIFLDIPFSKENTQVANSSYSKSFSKFTLITSDGVQYVFGGNNSAIEYSINFFDQYFSEWVANSWNLTKIIHPDGKEVNFTYERDNFINQLYISVYHNLNTETEGNGGTAGCNSSSILNSIKEYHNGMLVAPCYLKSITYTNGEINFTQSDSQELTYGVSDYYKPETKYLFINSFGNILKCCYPYLPILGDSPSASRSDAPSDIIDEISQLKWKKLDIIEIKDAMDIKYFYFEYNDKSGNNPFAFRHYDSMRPNTQRLFLEKITETGSSTNILDPIFDMAIQSNPPYKFEYNTSKPLPPYLANQCDHWGFYNGTYAPTGNNAAYSSYYQYKDTRTEFLLAGTLSKITYPTGGVTEFTFEPHQYCQQLKLKRWEGLDSTGNQIAGGIRIRKIKSYDLAYPEQAMAKEYFYTTGFKPSKNNTGLSSSGILGGQIKYYFNDFRVKAHNGNATYKKEVFSSQSVLPACHNTNGSHIGYSEVTEVRNNGEEGYTKYFYSNFDNSNNYQGFGDEKFENTILVSRTPYEPYNSNEHIRGKLLKQEDYNSKEKLVKRTDLTYTLTSKENDYVKTISADFYSLCSNSSLVYIAGTAYKIYTNNLLLTKKVETLFDADKPIAEYPILINTTDYSYNEQKLLKEEKVTGSQGSDLTEDTFTTQYRYIDDILPKRTGSTTWTAVDAYKQMSDKFMIGIPLETVKKYTPAGTTTAKTLSAEANLFKKVNTNSILPAERRLFLSDAPSTAYVPFTITNTTTPQLSLYSGLVNESTYTSYDIKGNIQEYVGKDGVVTTYIWGYNRQYPVVKVVGDTYANVKAKISAAELTTLETTLDGTQLATLTNKIRTGFASSDTQVFTYTYMPHVGLSSETDPNGISTYYEYDALGRLFRILDNDKK